MSTRGRRLPVVLCLAACLAASAWRPAAAEEAAADKLTAGIAQVRSGDFFRALMSLNDAAHDLAGRPGDAASLARAHAYLAVVHTRMGQPEKANAAVAQALQADPKIAVRAPDFPPEVVALFERARHASSTDPEAAGQLAEQAGRYQEAFLDYLDAYRAFPAAPPRDVDRRLRERIIGVAAHLEPRPAIPAEAQQHFDKAKALLEAQALLGGGAQDARSLEAAATEVAAALRIAPWWPQATFELANLQQKLGRLEDAVINVALYKRADPAGYAAAQAARKPDAAPAERPAPPAATVYVYWPGQFKGAGAYAVLCDGATMAKLGKKRFLALSVPPGAHTVSFGGHAVTGTYESGAEYYLRAGFEGFPAHKDLKAAEADLGRREVHEPEMQPTDERHTYATTCGASVAAVAGVRQR